MPRRSTQFTSAGRGPSTSYRMTKELPNIGRSNFCVIVYDKSVDPQTNRQLHTFVQFNQRFQNLHIDSLGWLIGTDILRSQLFADPHHVSPEFLFSVGIGGNVCFLANVNTIHISLVDIHTKRAEHPYPRWSESDQGSSMSSRRF